jgi:hypothetical protein
VIAAIERDIVRVQANTCDRSSDLDEWRRSRLPTFDRSL